MDKNKKLRPIYYYNNTFSLIQKTCEISKSENVNYIFMKLYSEIEESFMQTTK